MAWFSQTPQKGPNYILIMFICLVLAILSILVSIVYFLSTIGGPGLDILPSYLFDLLVVEIMLTAAGIYLFVTSFQVRTRNWHIDLGAILFGLILAVLGIVPLALDFNLLTFLPFNLVFEGSGIVFSIMLLLYGILLLARLRAIYVVWVQYGYY